MTENEVAVKAAREANEDKINHMSNGQEEGHDSGVDESTQSKEILRERPPAKDGSHPARRRQAKSTEPPFRRAQLSTTPAATSVERKLPMNKIEVGKSASPNIKACKSKIGASNPNYKPGGGNVKVLSQKMDFSTTSSRIQANNQGYAPKGGDRKIENQKLQWSAKSKIGSLDNAAHKSKGGDKKIESRKLTWNASSKIGSKDNMTHKAGGGDVIIPTEKLNFKEAANSKVGSMDNVKHRAGGGDKKIFDDKEYLRQTTSGVTSPTQRSSKLSSAGNSGAISPATTGTNSPGPQDEA